MLPPGPLLQITLALAAAFAQEGAGTGSGAGAAAFGAADAARAQFAVEVTRPPTDSALCPTERQVGDSLTAHMPGIVAADARATGARTLRLTVMQVSPNTVRLTLTDGAGVVVLERALDLTPPGARQPGRAASECAALADTVALIVERYLREIGYRPPPAQTSPAVAPVAAPPPPASSPPSVVGATSPTTAARPARFLLGVGSKLATPITGRDANSQSTLYVDLSGELHLRRIALSVSAGIGEATRTSAVPQTDGGTFELRSMPLRLAAALRLAAGPGYILPGVGAGVDVLWIATSGIGGDHPGTAFEPVVEIGAAYLLPLSRRFYVKALALSVLNLRPNDFGLNGLEDQPFIFRTARAYVRGGLELGVVFPN